jgi:hypothetical protein
LSDTDNKEIIREFKKDTLSHDLIAPYTRMSSNGDNIINLVKNIVAIHGIPQKWLRSRLIIISKTKDSFPMLGRHRPISVNSFPLRVLEAIIKQKLKHCDTCKLDLDHYQCGFRSHGDPRINIVKTLKFLAKKTGYMLTIDLSSAFDSLPRKTILKAILNKSNELCDK